MKKKSKAKNRKVLLPILVLAGVALVIGAWYSWTWFCDNRRPNFNNTSVVYVYPETSYDELCSQMQDTTSAVSWRSLERSMKKENVRQRLAPGRYEIRPEYTSRYVARMFANGWQTPCRLVLSGTMRQKNVIARKISAQMMIDSAAVHDALNDAALLSKWGFTPENVFSMIIPDTYSMWWTASIEDILGRQKAAYDDFWTAERLEKAKNLGLTPQQVSIVASIVKGESNHVPEYPKIAGVYLKRYKIGMKLQADPTIAFCYDYSINRILKAHLSIDSPYNTYLYKGLPPGPISVPTKECLEAVLNPDMKDGNIFFCADPSFNGTHRFARTLAEHNRNANEFHRALKNRNAK